MTADVVANKAVVNGSVQGVFFRQSCRQAARSLGLLGWVRNRPDGSVEVWAQGSRPAVDALIDWLWDGPPHAHVSGVESEDVAVDPSLQDFLITN